jgi:hypothetical protein
VHIDEVLTVRDANGQPLNQRGADQPAAPRSPGFLAPGGLCGDRLEPLRGAGLAYRERDHHHAVLVSVRWPERRIVQGHRHHGPQHQAGHVLPAGLQKVPKPTGDGGEHGIVDRAASTVGGVLHQIQAAADDGDAAPGPDRPVQAGAACPPLGEGSRIAGQVRRRRAAAAAGWAECDAELATALTYLRRLSRSRSRAAGAGRGRHGGAGGDVASGAWSSSLLSSATAAGPSAIAWYALWNMPTPHRAPPPSPRPFRPPGGPVGCGGWSRVT